MAARTRNKSGTLPEESTALVDQSIMDLVTTVLDRGSSEAMVV
ncbi:hypothetical protein [Lentzea sp.]|nr:hypothetical protein [Lentzea sp.]HUQ55278.1 hypothetical protein [Lentzea sp.]